MNTAINIRIVQEKGLPFIPTIDLKKICERWDKQVAQARFSNRFKDAKSVFRGL